MSFAFFRLPVVWASAYNKKAKVAYICRRERYRAWQNPGLQKELNETMISYIILRNGRGTHVS